MVKVNHLWLSQQHSHRQLPDLNCMSTLIETKQREGSEPNLCSLNLGTNFPKYFEAPLPNPSLYDNGKESVYPSDFNGVVVPKAHISGLSQKRILIFDQSDNHTRLTYSYVFPNPTIPNRSAQESQKLAISEVNQTDRTDDASVQESDEGEDTEEINALLDSDDSDSESGEDDEVTSTARYPIQAKERFPMQRRPREFTEEVASSDEPNKRRKIIDGEYDKSSVNEHENDAQSSCAEVGGSECTFGNTRSEKEKIRELLRVLESIIPGVKGKEPLLVIDEAIDYLRFAKSETQGLSFH